MNSLVSSSKRWFVLLASLSLVLVLGFVAAGCKKSGQAPPSDPKVFDSASAELKQLWATASSAMQTNGYATAYFTLEQMKAQPDLTEAQTQTIREQTTSLLARMNNAAERGDANAVESIKAIRAAGRTGR